MIEVAGGVVWNRKLGIAVVNQNHNSWSLPKGHVEAGEDLISAAEREIEEETGIPVEALIFVGKIAEYSRARIKRSDSDTEELRHITLFLFTTAHDELCPQDPDNPEAKWAEPDAVPELLSHPVDKEQFRSLIKLEIFQELIK